MNDDRDCRICLNHTSDSEQLIQPCRCHTSYVHEVCLQKWRKQNILNEKYNKCEICNTKYIINRNYPLETSFMRIIYAVHNNNNQRIDNQIPFIFPYYLFVSSGIFFSYMADQLLDSNTITFFIGEEKKMNFIREVNIFPMGWVIYYGGFSTMLFLNTILIFMLCIPICKVHRKYKYYNNMKKSYILYTFYSMFFPINLLFSYRFLDSISIFILINIIYFLTSYFSSVMFLESHNKTLFLLNTDSKETIVPFNYSQINTVIELQESTGESKKNEPLIENAELNNSMEEESDSENQYLIKF